MKLHSSPLQISPELSLPRNTETSALVVFGGRGSGKTNFGGVLVEEFSRAGIRFAVVDPMGVWWGLRHGMDRNEKGIDVLILGGIHGDLPIKPEAGALIADLVADENANVIIDISRHPDGSMWAISERIRFVTAFAMRIYQRQGEKRIPLTLVIDEVARFAPQQVRSGEIEVAKCMGAIAVLVEEGRNVGIGVVMITQRSARLNKDVAELADCMIAFRTVGPNSMAAILDWLGEHVEKARLKEIGSKLRELPVGSALVVSPGWLKFEGIVGVRKRTTFDSSATPESGKKVQAPTGGTRPDLAKYRARLAELVKETEENDPKTLKLRIVKLDTEKRTLAAQLAAAQASTAGATASAAGTAKATKTKVIEVKQNVIAPKQLTQIGSLLTRGEALIKRWDDRSANAHAGLTEVHEQTDSLLKTLAPMLASIGSAIDAYRAMPATRPTSVDSSSSSLNGHAKRTKPAPRPTSGDETRADSPPASGGAGEGAKMPPQMQRFLTVLAQRGPQTQADILMYSGTSRNGATDRTFKAMKELGYVNSGSSPADKVTLSLSGLGAEALGAWTTPLPPRLAPQERLFMVALAWAGPRTAKSVMTITGTSRNGATDRTWRGIKRKGWVSDDGGKVAITAFGREVLGTYEPCPFGDALGDALVAGTHGGMSPMERRFLDVIRKHDGITGKDVLVELGASRNGATDRAFRYLTKIGYVRRNDDDRLIVADELWDGGMS